MIPALGRWLSVVCLLAVAARPEDRSLVERRLETLRRVLPDSPQPPTDIALIRELATASRLGSLEVTARPPMESGARGWVPIEVSAVARYDAIDRFFRQVALSPRLIDVEGLTLIAQPGHMVKLTATLNVPYRSTHAPAHRAPASDFTAPATREADAFAKEQAVLAAKAEEIAALRRARRNPRLFLSELAAATRDRPVVIARATLGDEMLISGLVMGESAMRDLQSRFERGFFRVAEVLVARQSACLRFEVRGKAPIVGPDAEIPLPGTEPFDVEDSSCRPDRDAGRPLVIRTPISKAPPRGLVNVRLRDVDLADVFQVLHLATGQGFVVDGDVQGRVSVELAGLDLERALDVIGKAGVRVSPPGPLRRVSRADRPQTPAKPLARAPGAPAPRQRSMLVKRTPVREVLTLLDEALAPPPEPVEGTDAAAAAAARVTWAPPGDLGRISIWARDTPVDALRAAVLEAAALVETVNDDRRVVRPAGSTEGTPLPVTTGPVFRRLLVQPAALTTVELSLSGVALLPEGWTALAYAPSGALFRYKRGDRLADAAVAEVQSTDALIETEEGPYRLMLPDAR